MKCANRNCGKEFEPSKHAGGLRQIYCSKKCGNAARERTKRKTNPDVKFKRELSEKKYRDTHPEQVHKSAMKARARKYRSGKNLPKWMNS